MKVDALTCCPGHMNDFHLVSFHLSIVVLFARRWNCQLRLENSLRLGRTPSRFDEANGVSEARSWGAVCERRIESGITITAVLYVVVAHALMMRHDARCVVVVFELRLDHFYLCMDRCPFSPNPSGFKYQSICRIPIPQTP